MRLQGKLKLQAPPQKRTPFGALTRPSISIDRQSILYLPGDSMTVIRTIGPALLTLCLGFGVWDASAQRPVIRDSAGIRITQNPARSKLPVIYRMGEPLWDLGGLQSDPAREWGRQGGFHAVILSTGNVVVSDGRLLRYYDRSGREVGSFGRDGEGPGEFRQITSLCVRVGDTVQVNDGGLQRTTVISPTRALVRTVTGRVPQEVRGCLDDGTVISAAILSGIGDGYTQWVGLTGLSADGAPRTDFGPFPLRQLGTVRRDGSVAVQGARIVLAPGTEASFSVLDARGKLVHIIRLDEKPDPVTGADIKRGVGVTQMVNLRTGAAAAAAPPSTTKESWPAHGVVRLDPLNRIWVEDNLKQGNRGWTIIGASGEALGRFVLPESPTETGATVLGFSTEGVLLRRQDGDGAYHVTHYRLVPVRQ